MTHDPTSNLSRSRGDHAGGRARAGSDAAVLGRAFRQHVLHPLDRARGAARAGSGAPARWPRCWAVHRTRSSSRAAAPRATIWRFAAWPLRRARGQTRQSYHHPPDRASRRRRDRRAAARSARLRGDVRRSRSIWHGRSGCDRAGDSLRHDLDQRDVRQQRSRHGAADGGDRRDGARERHRLSHRCGAGRRAAEPQRRSLAASICWRCRRTSFTGRRAWGCCTSDRARN